MPTIEEKRMFDERADKMNAFDQDWITLDNGIRLKISNIIGYHRNGDQQFTKIMTSAGDGTIFPANETPDELDIMLGKTVSKK